MSIVIGRYFLVKRYINQGNSNTERHLTGVGFQVNIFSSLSSWWKVWQCPGRHDAGKGTESSTS